ncbi:short-chain dehydrogenase/reductase SDR [Reticulomyxa filosa]|uniref:Short-chain dehydrogenase/reductase SDR n=1 Tax=Reticulomyxa filosa TaxID=46433 RepID=X6MTD1_RETFI|nr:short-chain dehydrogenase/reductase SDR [Reticulomyxa filosa]|eukprot:ETO16876.1 short-chain dehydrogenase/reductase SDR [Reticulomyxa filosa]
MFSQVLNPLVRSCKRNLLSNSRKFCEQASPSLRVMISGGSSGLGKAITELLAEKKCKVLSVDISKQRNEEMEELFSKKKEGKFVKFLHLDISNASNAQKAVDYIVSEFQGIDILINNAAIQPGNGIPLHELSNETWMETINVNFNSVFYLSKYVIPHMLRQARKHLEDKTVNYNHIINMASVQGLACEKGVSVYAAMKGAVLTLTKQMACEYSPFIRVNSISPGTIRTPLIEKNYKEFGVSLEEISKKYPMNRLGQPLEVAELTYFLCRSDRVSWLTGQNIVVDGGITAQGGWSAITVPNDTAKLDAMLNAVSHSQTSSSTKSAKKRLKSDKK